VANCQPVPGAILGGEDNPVLLKCPNCGPKQTWLFRGFVQDGAGRKVEATCSLCGTVRYLTPITAGLVPLDTLREQVKEEPERKKAEKPQPMPPEPPPMSESQELSSPPPLTLLSADEILTTTWPEPVWAIPGILPAGLSILAGKSKVGKSWLALQIAQAVAAGGVVLGERVEQGRVLYLALEDSGARLRNRMQRQNWPMGLQADFMILGRFLEEIGDLANGGGDRIATQIYERRYRLVVIDTLSRAVFGDQNDVVAMTAALSPLQEMAHTFNCAVTLLDHHNKLRGSNPDVILDILGSTAKGALSDTILGLYRERGQAGAKLLIIGRDIEEQELALQWDSIAWCWQRRDDVEGGLALTENRQDILAVLSDLSPASLNELVEVLSRSKGAVYKDLEDLVHASLLVKVGKGRGNVRYSLKENSTFEEIKTTRQLGKPGN